MTPARVLVADPPWQPDDELPGPGRGAAKHYPTMPVAQLAFFPLPVLDPDAVLFLWRLSSMQGEALFLARAWGFEPHSELVWNKTKNGIRFFGMGRIVRGGHESCLIATRVRTPTPRNRSISSRFEAPVGRHSAKPDRFYEIVEALYPGPYVELFARRTRPGWLTYGNELAQAHP